jgi:hypothetical protein
LTIRGRQVDGMTDVEGDTPAETRQERLARRKRMVRLATAAGAAPVSRPLTAELIPSGLWWVNLRSILRPSEWDAVRQAVYAAAGSRCELCGGVGQQHAVEAHELWAWDLLQHEQRLIRLVALCPGCHLVKHAGRARVIGREQEVRDQLQTVNGWSEAQARAHLRGAWDDWARRSVDEWRLDLSVLEIEVTDKLVARAKARSGGQRRRALAARATARSRPVLPAGHET